MKLNNFLMARKRFGILKISKYLSNFPLVIKSEAHPDVNKSSFNQLSIVVKSISFRSIVQSHVYNANSNRFLSRRPEEGIKF